MAPIIPKHPPIPPIIVSCKIVEKKSPKRLAVILETKKRMMVFVGPIRCSKVLPQRRIRRIVLESSGRFSWRKAQVKIQ